ncbi:MAG TPA: carboxypeptidase-like regulatory domain-containing protein, partial [Longimicrobiales bacterium]|nr:carboxypeptidase-like regulatory domain-containing protein [Longimicrobiales bacterium]
MRPLRQHLAVGILLGCVSLVAGVSRGAAQESTIAGTVVESKSLKPLAGAQVLVQGQGRGVLSDANGRFRITGVTGTDVTLEIVMIGYRARTLPARV